MASFCQSAGRLLRGPPGAGRWGVLNGIFQVVKEPVVSCSSQTPGCGSNRRWPIGWSRRGFIYHRDSIGEDDPRGLVGCMWLYWKEKGLLRIGEWPSLLRRHFAFEYGRRARQCLESHWELLYSLSSLPTHTLHGLPVEVSEAARFRPKLLHALGTRSLIINVRVKICWHDSYRCRITLVASPALIWTESSNTSPADRNKRVDGHSTLTNSSPRAGCRDCSSIFTKLPVNRNVHPESDALEHPESDALEKEPFFLPAFKSGERVKMDRRQPKREGTKSSLRS